MLLTAFFLLANSLVVLSSPGQRASAVVKSGGVTLKDLDTLTESARAGRTRLASCGSGFFISSDGAFLTNHHVVDNAKELIAVWNGTAYRVVVVASDKSVDLALLRFDGVPVALDGGELNFRNYVQPSFPFLGTDTMTGCEVGNEVYVVGYPKIDLQGLEAKVTRGIVSSLSGFKGEAANFQMDAAIQGGNSGGPVVDVHGALVGVSVATLIGGQNGNYAIKLGEIEKFLSAQKVRFATSLKMPHSRSAMLKKVIATTVLILNYEEGARPPSFDDETRPVKERNEARARFEKTLLYAKLLKVRKEWKELKKLTGTLLKEYGDEVGDGDIKELNALARKELGEDGKDGEKEK